MRSEGLRRKKMMMVLENPEVLVWGWMRRWVTVVAGWTYPVLAAVVGEV